MSVLDPEPNIPRDDTGKGLRMIGWFLLLWTGVTLVWIPEHLRWTSYMKWVDIVCFIGGVFFVAAGYYIARHAPNEIELDERAHDLIASSEDGSDQHEEFETGNGPGRFPTHRAA